MGHFKALAAKAPGQGPPPKEPAAVAPGRGPPPKTLHSIGTLKRTEDPHVEFFEWHYKKILHKFLVWDWFTKPVKLLDRNIHELS